MKNTSYLKHILELLNEVPDDFISMHDSYNSDIVKMFGVSEEQAADISAWLIKSMLYNGYTISMERELKKHLPEQWHNYLEEGEFIFDGVKYSEKGKVINETNITE